MPIENKDKTYNLNKKQEKEFYGALAGRFSLVGWRTKGRGEYILAGSQAIEGYYGEEKNFLRTIGKINQGRVTVFADWPMGLPAYKNERKELCDLCEDLASKK